jgi:translation initiation factor IF-2
METRSIAIGLIAIVAAFAAAFGVAKSGGSKTETAGAGVKAETIKVAAPAPVAGVAVGGTIPALRAAPKPVAKKKAKKKSSGGSTASAPSTSNSSSNSNSTSNSAPAPQQSAPSSPAPSAPAPSAPAPRAPAPKPSQPAPVSGGGEDG